jgi:cadmium resistance protein CadD (predicted permease)
VSILASLISLILPPGYIGLLGVVPIGIGLNKLFSLWRSDEEAEEGHKSGVGNIFVVIAVTVANGADNIGVYVPVFATRTSTEISIIVLVFIVMVAMWLLLAHALVNHPVFGVPIRRYGHVIVPFALIAIGLMVLAEAGTISLLWAIT